MEKKLKIIYMTLLIMVIIIIISIIYILIDFYKDVKCSNATDIKWFLENNCEKYME